MSAWIQAGCAAGSALATYALLVLVLALAGRRELARAVAGFVPDCLVLFHRLLRDPCVPGRSKVLVAALVPYLAMPFDLVPDFVPVAGLLDDAVIVAFVLRRVVRRAGPALVASHWPGPDASLRLVLALAGSSYSSSQATARISGSSTATARQKRPPSLET